MDGIKEQVKSDVLEEGTIEELTLSGRQRWQSAPVYVPSDSVRGDAEVSADSSSDFYVLDHPSSEIIEGEVFATNDLKSTARVQNVAEIESTAEGIDVPTYFNEGVDLPHLGYKAVYLSTNCSVFVYTSSTLIRLSSFDFFFAIFYSFSRMQAAKIRNSHYAFKISLYDSFQEP